MPQLKRAKYDRNASAARCLRLRRRILDMSQKVTALHIAGAYSCMEIVETIYFQLIRRDENNKLADTFLMSKGHGCLAQYTSLNELGILSDKDLDQYCKPDGILGTHPDYGNPGIEASTGSLGHGLAMAMGMAYADRLQKLDRDVHVVMSDGELQEGSVWEAILLAPALKLTNLIAYVDLNDFQSLGRTSESHPNFFPVPEKLQAFGWECVEVSGHNTEEIYNAVNSRRGDKPMMVCCRTTKGRGVSYMENVPIWHYRSPSPDEYKQAMNELKEIRE